MDVWNSREQLCLIDGVLRNGSTNWGPVVQYLTQLSGPERPANYYTEEKCASQYQKLQCRTTDQNCPTASEPNKKNWTDTCHSKLVQNRIKELKAAVDEAKKNYYFYKQQISSLKTGVLDDMLNTFLNPETSRKELPVRKAEPENVSTDVPQESSVPTKESEIVAEVHVESEVTLTDEIQEGHGLQAKIITTQEIETIIEKETPETVTVPSTVVVADDSNAGNALTEETAIEVGEEVLVEEVAEELPEDTQPVASTEELETVEETVVATVETVTSEEHVKEAGKPQEIEETVEPSEVTIKEELPTPLIETSVSQIEEVPVEEKEVPDNEKRVPSPVAQEVSAPAEEPIIIKEEVVEPATAEQPVSEAVDTSVPVEEEPSKKTDVMESEDEDIPLKVLRSKLQPKAEPPSTAINTVSTENVPEPAEAPAVDSGVIPTPIEAEDTKDVSKTLLRTDSISALSNRETNEEILNFNKAATAFFKALGALDNASLLNKSLPSELSAGILRPMDLGVIRKNVENQTVLTQKDLVRDILLMFSNIFLAYESQSQVQRDAQILYKHTLELIKETFPNVIPIANERVQEIAPRLPELPLKETPQLGKSRKGGKRQNSPMNDDSVGKRKKFVAE